VPLLFGAAGAQLPPELRLAPGPTDFVFFKAGIVRASPLENWGGEQSRLFFPLKKAAPYPIGQHLTLPSAPATNH